jgi:hypothetical protein
MSEDGIFAVVILCVLSFVLIVGFFLVIDHTRSDNNYIIKTENITISGTDYGNMMTPFYVFASNGYRYDVAVKNSYIYKYSQNHQCRNVVITYKEYCDGRNREIIEMFDSCGQPISCNSHSCNNQCTSCGCS